MLIATIPLPTEPAWLATTKDVIQIVVLLVGTIVGFLQVRAHRKNRHMQSLLAVLGLVQDETLSQARWFAFEHHKEFGELLKAPFASESERRRRLDQFIREKSGDKLDLQKYRQGVQTMNLVAFLIRNGYVHASVVPEYLAASIQRAYQYFRDWIIYRRTTGRIPLGPRNSQSPPEQEPSRYCEHLEKLSGSIGRGYRFKIDRLAPIREFLNQLEQFGSTRVGRDVSERIDGVEEDLGEIRRLLDCTGTNTTAAP
jgi:hypothetical protein